MPVETQVDLNAAVRSGGLNITAESREDPRDQAHRHSEEALASRFDRVKDGARFALSSMVLLAVGGLATYFAVRPTSTPDEAAWARTVLAGLATAFGGYYLGKSSKG